jgi:release factor glutamine methyltransferase
VVIHINTYNDIYFNVRNILREQNIEGSVIEARLICASACGKTVAEFLRDSRMYVTQDSYIDTVKQMLRRRLDGEPVAYVTGTWEFYGLPMNVNKDVLIPRIDTEVLCQQAIEFCKTRTGNIRVLDLCSGSGCVGIAVAANVSRARVILADKSVKALAVGRSNVLLNNVSQNVSSIELDALSPPPSALGTFDLILSNPPYIPTADIQTLDVDVKDYEPHMALDGGDDGLDFYRAITRNFRGIIRPGGALMYECGIEQAVPVADIMQKAGFEDINFTQDTLGINRVVQGIYVNGGK